MRFGAELVFSLCEQQGIEVVIIHQGEQPGFEEELAQDVLEIITVFSARLYGARSHKSKRLLDALAGDERGNRDRNRAATVAAWIAVKRAHRIALRPTPEQESLFGQHAGYARFAYNWALGEFKAGLDVGEWLSDRSLRPRWNKVKRLIAPWAAVLSQNAAKYAVIDLGQAVDNWSAYRKRLKAGQPAGRPRRLSQVQAP